MTSFEIINSSIKNAMNKSAVSCLMVSVSNICESTYFSNPNIDGEACLTIKDTLPIGYPITFWNQW